MYVRVNFELSLTSERNERYSRSTQTQQRTPTHLPCLSHISLHSDAKLILDLLLCNTPDSYPNPKQPQISVQSPALIQRSFFTRVNHQTPETSTVSDMNVLGGQRRDYTGQEPDRWAHLGRAQEGERRVNYHLQSMCFIYQVHVSSFLYIFSLNFHNNFAQWEFFSFFTNREIKIQGGCDRLQENMATKNASLMCTHLLP